MRDRAMERATVERKLERVTWMYEQGDYSADEYRAKRDALKAELAALASVQPSTVDLERAAALLGNLTELWDGATEEERRGIIAGIVEAVWCDLDGKHAVAIQPHQWFYPLRKAFPTAWSYCGTDEDCVRERDTAAASDSLVPDRVFPAYFPLAAIPSRDPTSSLRRSATVDRARWPEIAARSRGESLRTLATSFGVSHETIRRILKRIETECDTGSAA